MVLKIKLLKEKLKIYLIGEIIILFVFAVNLLVFINHFEFFKIIKLFSFFYTIIEFFYILDFCKNTQWYEFYENEIIVKNIFGVVNHVKIKNITQSYEIQLPYFTRDKGCNCYVFIDERPIFKSPFNINVNNGKNICVRVPKTIETENFVKLKGIKTLKKNLNEII